MDSKELAKLVDFGTTHGFDSLMVVRRGKIVAETYYAPSSANDRGTSGCLSKDELDPLKDPEIRLLMDSFHFLAKYVRLILYPKKSALRHTLLLAACSRRAVQP